MVSSPLQPVLVMPVYRGGDKFRRALASVRPVEPYFRRIVISLNAPRGSPDEATINEYRLAGDTKIEVIQTEKELPWIPHQYFWLQYLENTGDRSDDWVMWFAHDDQLRARGITGLVDKLGNWPLDEETIYLGPWGVRYDPPGQLFDGNPDDPLESWTSFPLNGPLRMPVARWIADQFTQPTYINMSGCVTALKSFQQLRGFAYDKPGGMRIEMATAAAPYNKFAQEFTEPLVTTYTSKGSDRTTYSRVARKDDAHMVAWLANYTAHHPGAIRSLARTPITIAQQRIGHSLGRRQPVTEDWRYRKTVEP